MYPEILVEMAPGDALDGLGISGGDPEDGVIAVVPLLRVDDFFNTDFVFEGRAQTSSGSDDDRCIIGSSQQGNASKGGCRSAKEIDKEAPAAGVLVGEETDNLAGIEDLGNSGGGALFGDDSLAALFAHAEDVAVHVGVW